ncbi:hypothetical protein [Nocardia wallacei]|uniref:hypothetical protein n=1 Tax=Nocardia wallacei TaxID=480035 RepID=UPI00245651A9|nr:hypothetical protein [Nocardia wallacei]
MPAEFADTIRKRRLELGLTQTHDRPVLGAATFAVARWSDLVGRRVLMLIDAV